jgi:hypothetical protein
VLFFGKTIGFFATPLLLFILLFASIVILLEGLAHSFPSLTYSGIDIPQTFNTRKKNAGAKG